jgi:iron complex transport system ATP-binding protein
VRGWTLDGVGLRAGEQGRWLCRGLQAQIEPGHRWVLLGPNGAGKSTLLAALAGLALPAQGQISLHGQTLAAWPPKALAGERAWCPPHWSDPFPATVAETVGLARDDAADSAQLTTQLQAFDVHALAQADVRTLSGGERQRVALAAAWWQGAPALLLDEPTAHLDLAHQEMLLARLWAHTGDGVGSAVVSLHDLNLAWRLATHAVVFDGRGSAAAGPRDEVITPERLSGAFGVPVAWVQVCGQRRLWVGSMALGE